MNKYTCMVSDKDKLTVYSTTEISQPVVALVMEHSPYGNEDGSKISVCLTMADTRKLRDQLDTLLGDLA